MAQDRMEDKENTIKTYLEEIHKLTNELRLIPGWVDSPTDSNKT